MPHTGMQMERWWWLASIPSNRRDEARLARGYIDVMEVVPSGLIFYLD